MVLNQPVVAVPYDYSQPIDTTVAPASATVVDPAMATFDAARGAFKQGDYAQALTQTDAALKTLPSDTALHEFRALCLFALSRYDEAAATLYAVLAVGPGWDWATLIGLYPDVDVYTAQLRALEAYCDANTNAAPPRFVLGYHYLTEGHVDAAATVFKQVVAIMPSDTLSAKLARQLEPAKEQHGNRCDIDPPGRHGRTPGGVDQRDLEGAAGRRHRDRPDDPARGRLHLGGHQEGQAPEVLRDLDVRRRHPHPGPGAGPGAGRPRELEGRRPHDIPGGRRWPGRSGGQLLEVRAGPGSPEGAESSISGRREPHPPHPPGPLADARRLCLVRGGIGRLSGSGPAVLSAYVARGRVRRFSRGRTLPAIGLDDGREVEIVSGLAPDEPVVVRYNGTIAEGLAVRAEPVKTAGDRGQR